MEGIIGIRYAKALIQLTPVAELETAAQQLEGLASSYLANEAFQNYIQDPKVTKPQKMARVAEIATKSGFSANVTRFLRYLTSQGRFQVIGSVARSFSDQADQKLGRTKASLKVAETLAPAELDKLKHSLAGYAKKDILLEVEVDPSLLGGAVAQLGSIVLDGSIKNRLKLIKDNISKG